MSVQHKVWGDCGGYLAGFTPVCGLQLKMPPEDTNFGIIQIIQVYKAAGLGGNWLHLANFFFFNVAN